MKWNPALHQSIPIRELRNLEFSQTYREIGSRIAQIESALKKSALKDEGDLKRQKKKEQEKLRALKRQKLKELQVSQQIVYETEECPHKQWDWRRSKFHRIQHMLSDERIRLIDVMKEPLIPRSKEWVSALQDLVTLRKASSQLAFQDGLRPVDGGCPSCTTAMNEYVGAASAMLNAKMLISFSLELL